MTIAINIKVNDGVVLATDSASTFMAQGSNGELGVINVYDNANKLFNIHKQLPVGIITWGAGSIGLESTSTVIKDFRKDLMENNIILEENYKIEEIAQKFKDFFMKKYDNEFLKWPQKPEIGFIIAGFSKDSNIPEEWQLQIINGTCRGPIKLRNKDECGITWNGQPEAITRLLSGYPPFLFDLIAKSGLVEINKMPELVKVIEQNCSAPSVISPAMPIKDAIDLAEFLVDLTEKFVRFTPGAQTVGGPIEIAAITAHEGFKWIKRKHYYEKELN